jgi:hypothetical protein
MTQSPSAVLLHIGSEETQVTIDGKTHRLTLGSQLTSLGYFRHQPPTPAEMENAIMVVEDEVTGRRGRVFIAKITIFARSLASLASQKTSRCRSHWTPSSGPSTASRW